jgi:murein DD-endopeptidase MepM/ murein hydrolase activator NlpD
MLVCTSSSPAAEEVSRPPEHPAHGPAGTRTQLPDQLTPAILQARTAAALDAQGTPAFLTRPYIGAHYLTSVFDHSRPDYTVDGRVVRFDGVVAQASCGVDPGFAWGYKICGTQDYLYYDGHNGWDIALNYEPVLAAAEGTVTLAGWDAVSPGFGISVIIDHPNGLTTRYGHLSGVSVSRGQQVLRGGRLGTSGSTGFSTGPHLHFGVYLTSTWIAIDPYGWTGAGADPWPYDRGNLWLTGVPQDPLPSAPTQVQAIAGDASARLTWLAPAFDGGQPLAAYTITASPGGRTAVVGGGSTSGVVTGLENDRAFTFTVTAQNAGGAAAVSGASNSVTPTASWPGLLHAVAPARIADSRTGLGLTRLGPSEVASVPVLGQGPIPAGGVSGVLVNVTAVDGTDAGFLTINSTGVPSPITSNVNYMPGEQAANLVSSGVGPDGRVAVKNGSWGSVDVILDVSGWYSGPSIGGPEGRLRALAPARLADTRTGLGGSGRLSANRSVSLQVAGKGGVPSGFSGAAVLNLTVDNASQPSYFSVYPSGQSPPLVSNLNFTPGQQRANRVVVKVGSGGRIDLYNSAGEAEAIIDVAGYFTDATIEGPPPGRFASLPPARIYDTRDGTGQARGPLRPNSWVEVGVTGLAGVPAMSADPPPRAVLLNLTVSNPSQTSFFSVDPVGGAIRTSDLNFAFGQTRANLVVAPVGADGRVRLFNAAGTAEAIIDLLGWFS